jgi:hypothetical protein
MLDVIPVFENDDAKNEFIEAINSLIEDGVIHYGFKIDPLPRLMLRYTNSKIREIINIGLYEYEENTKDLVSTFKCIELYRDSIYIEDVSTDQIIEEPINSNSLITLNPSHINENGTDEYFGNNGILILNDPNDVKMQNRRYSLMVETIPKVEFDSGIFYEVKLRFLSIKY